jgi:APA family basic amino acid/polyamine antiporter
LLCARTGLLALLVDLEALAELVSIGTLFVFGAVAAGLVWRRCVDGRVPDQAVRTVWRLLAVVTASLGKAPGRREDADTASDLPCSAAL